MIPADKLFLPNEKAINLSQGKLSQFTLVMYILVRIFKMYSPEDIIGKTMSAMVMVTED